MSTRKGYLIRVGIDKGTDRVLAPIFSDGSFEYIPFSECEVEKDDPNTYGQLPARSGGVLADYLPSRLRNCVPHYDPEFETPSYGDPTSKKRTLIKLHKGDLLVFQAGLQPYNTSAYPERANYIIGYFTVNRVVDFQSLKNVNLQDYNREWTLLAKNFHIWFRNEKDTFVVVGEAGKSFLLKYAYPFTELRADSSGRPTIAIRSDLEESIGIKGFVQRSTPREIPETGVMFLESTLRKYI